ncbi:MAG: FG-GAP-like repeat-containing protein [Bacteroidia bacterium]
MATFRKTFFLLAFCSIFGIATAQPFTKITDTSNPVVAGAPLSQNGYQGASWIDFNNDGLQDLFVIRRALYQNLGNGQFLKVSPNGLSTGFGYGNTWADYDNDGDIDCFISGGNQRGSSLFTNNGNGTFSKNMTAGIADSLALRGWGSAFGDYDNDGFTDIVIAAPFGFASITDGNKLLHNNGNQTFTKIDTSVVAIGTAPYTVPTWCDYDEDGDMDIFIGSGPANGTIEPDYLYHNQLKESNVPSYFTKITTAPIATDLADGQVWNWIDYDNDKDLDAFVTNYTGTQNGMENALYRKEANGTFTRMTAAVVGSILSDKYLSLASIWEDFDNDGDLDCFVTNDGNVKNNYYQNNGDGTFSAITSYALTSQAASYAGATSADYDNDGDIDLFVYGTNHSLFRNDLANGNHWVNLKLIGTQSNRSAIGSVAYLKATINGVSTWQTRQISAQNSFNGMSSLNAEYGLGDATIIDSLVVKWASGHTDICTNIAADKFYTLTEGQCPMMVSLENGYAAPHFQLQIAPNPSKQQTKFSYQLAKSSQVSLTIYDSSGKKVAQPLYEFQTKGEHQFQWNHSELSAGLYFCILSAEGQQQTQQLMILE